jgi:hypothetical protein
MVLVCLLAVHDGCRRSPVTTPVGVADGGDKGSDALMADGAVTDGVVAAKDAARSDAASSAGGAGGDGATTGAGGSGGPIVSNDVAVVLDGQKWLVPCGPPQSLSGLVCVNMAGSICPQSTAIPYLTRGMINRDDTVTFGGTPGKTYDVRVRIQGVVEPKHYGGGTKDLQHEGWYVGGTPNMTGNYGVYMLGVSDPPQVYYLNALSQNEAHFTYPIDYTVTVPIASGAQVRFLASDSNCSAIRNCDATSIDSIPGISVCAALQLPDVTPSDVAQPYNGQFMVMHVLSVSEDIGGNSSPAGAPGSLVIAPGPVVTSMSTKMQLRALLVAADGSLSGDMTVAATWTSSDESVATVGGGALSTTSGGVTTIRAAMGNTVAETTVRVLGAAVTGIEISPAAPKIAPGVKVAFMAAAIYADGRRRDISSLVQWRASDPSVSMAFQEGRLVATGVTPGGTSVISATLQGMTAAAVLVVKSAPLQSIEISPASASATCKSGAAFTAQGRYADGDTLDVTSSATWSGDTLTFLTSVVAAEQAAPTCDGGGVGTHAVQATLAGVTGSASFTVTPGMLFSVDIQRTPGVGILIPLHATQRVLVNATYDTGYSADVTARATWQSETPDVADFSTVPGWENLLITKTLGLTVLNATVDGLLGYGDCNVTDTAIISIDIQPKNGTVTPSGFVLRAFATFADGTVYDVGATSTWSTGNPQIARVSNNAGTWGLVTPVASGTTPISAKIGNVAGSTTVVVP